MVRTVVGFGILPNATVIKLERNDGGRIDSTGEPITIAPLTGVDARTRGVELMSLLQAHEPVSRALRAALDIAPGAAVRPLYFHVESQAADALPWELLHDERAGFCALDDRWPIGRVAREARGLTSRGFAGELKIVAVLAAAQRSGLAQLNGLIEAICSPAGRQIGARLHVITGESAVIAQARAVGDPVTVEEIATSARDVADQIAAAEPGILHVLAHGAVQQDTGTLYLARTVDQLAGAGRGQLVMPLVMIAQALSACNPWLIVLAACGTGGSEQGPALSHDLVNIGLPAVVGMRRLVDLGQTDRFCRALYRRITTMLSATLITDRVTEVELDWAPVVTAARQSVLGADPVADDAWSDPVLYAQTEPLRIICTPPGNRAALFEASRMQSILDLARALRATLGPDATVALAEIDAQIETFEAQLAAVGR